MGHPRVSPCTDDLDHHRRKHVLLAYLEIALQPFTGQPASTSARMAGIRVMPTRKQLLYAGRAAMCVGQNVCMYNRPT